MNPPMRNISIVIAIGNIIVFIDYCSYLSYQKNKQPMKDTEVSLID